MGKMIEKIDLCNECYLDKAEYVFFKPGIFNIYLRLLCKSCAKKQSDAERLGVI